MQGACWPRRAGDAIIQAPDRRRNFLIDSTQDEAEHPALSPGSGVYILLDPWEPLNKSIVDLSEGAESGAGPDSATPHQAHVCLMRGKPSLACGRSELNQTFP